MRWMLSIWTPIRQSVTSVVLAGLAIFPAWADSTPLFWKVTSAYDANTHLYVLGSIHLGRADFYPLPKAIDQAFMDSDVLAVEMDVTALDLFQTGAVMSRYAVLPPGQTLRQQLPAPLWQKLERAAAQSAMPLQTMQSFQPWFVAMQLELSAFQQRGFSELYGVDLYFLKQKQNKQVLSIETLEEQLGVFQQLNQAEQQYFLEMTLRSFEQVDQHVETFARVWQEGDAQQLNALVLQDRDANHPAARKIHELLFTRRNQRMLEAAEKMLRSGQSGFMVVGAAHLLGAEGVVAGLQARDHRVERVVFSR